MCLKIWHALKIQHSHFFRRRSWTKRWQLRGSRWFKDSYKTSPFLGVSFYFLAGASFYLGHRRPRTFSRAWSDLLQGLTWWGWRLQKFLLGISPCPPRCYPCLRYNRWGQLSQGWSASSAFSSTASFIFVLCCHPFQMTTTIDHNVDCPKRCKAGWRSWKRCSALTSVLSLLATRWKWTKEVIVHLACHLENFLNQQLQSASRVIRLIWRRIETLTGRQRNVTPIV